MVSLVKKTPITGCGAFCPPPELLKNTKCSSVGTFGVFYKKGNGEFELYYVAADQLIPVSPPKGSRRSPVSQLKVKKTNPISYMATNPEECLLATNLKDFLSQLINMKIGEKISQSNKSPISSFLCTLLCRVVDDDQIQSFEEEGRKKELTKSFLQHFYEIEGEKAIREHLTKTETGGRFSIPNIALIQVDR